MYYGIEMLQNECSRHDNREKFFHCHHRCPLFHPNESPSFFVGFCENFNKFYVSQLKETCRM